MGDADLLTFYSFEFSLRWLAINFCGYAQMEAEKDDETKRDKESGIEAVWPVKNAKLSIKVAQNDFTGKMKDFDNFTKIA